MSTTEKAQILTDKQIGIFKDGLENLIAELGTAQDKRSYSKFVNKKNLSHEANRAELEALYRTDWMAGKIVDIIPDDMTREWRTFKGDIDPETVKGLEEEETRIDLPGNFMQAHIWGRLYGTSYIVLSVDDGQNSDKPLRLDGLKEGSLKHIKAVDRYRLTHAGGAPIGDPMNPHFGLPEYYQFVGAGATANTRIHHSRVIRFEGVKLPYDSFRENNYISDSVLSRLYDPLINFSTVSTGAASMVFETNVDIMKVKGLMNYLSTSAGEELLRKRFTLAGLMKSFNNMMLLDSEETYENKSNTFAGLPDLLDRYGLHVGAGGDVPATRLLGSSASGFNATGEGDLKNYYDTIRSSQKKNYRPKIDYVDQIIAKSLGISLEADLSYEFNSLFQITPKEQADKEFVDAQRDAIYLDRGVVGEDVVAKELKQNDVYTNIRDEDLEEPDNDEDDEDNEDDDDFNLGNGG